MKYVDEFRDADLAKSLVQQIRATARRRWTIMEVCGGQTHGLLRYGIPHAVHDAVELIHGPGCPVCVTSQDNIDRAQAMALQPGVALTSFGDMLRVPGSEFSLLQVRARGGDVRIVYSPMDAVRLAIREPDLQVVFFAVGFETTMPATALAVLQAAERNLTNFSVLVSHVRVQPAMEQILQARDCRVQAFLAAGHVCTVTGYECYRDMVSQHRIPIAVTGFEPLDLLSGILNCVRQLEAQTAELTNCYPRAVSAEGNAAAVDLVDRVYEVADQEWRGIGLIPQGGFRLRNAWERFDAAKRFHTRLTPVQHSGLSQSDCRAGDVLSGRIRPPDCSHFGRGCTPETPLGAPMVSSEGACAAWYQYAGTSHDHLEPVR